MTRILNIALVILAITLAGSGFYFAAKLPRNTEVRYNCDMAEFHPDFPLEVRKKCRELRSIK